MKFHHWALPILSLLAFIAFLLIQTFGIDKINDEIRFAFYYDKPEQQYGLERLTAYLEAWRWDEGVYLEDKFDCSEMSACLERELENYGYHTFIVGSRFFYEEGGHTWLIVEFERNAYIPIESTSCQLVMPNSPLFAYYYKYTEKFETIEDAYRHSKTEYDWWNKE